MAITERLELELDDALSSIGQLDTALAGIGSGLSSEITAALAPLEGLEVTIDLSSSLDEVDEIGAALISAAQDFSDFLLKALEAASQAQVVLTDVDVSRLDESIGDVLRGAEDTPFVPTVDVGPAEDQIVDAVGGLDLEVPVGADTTTIPATLDEAVQSVDAVLKVDGDATSIPDQIDATLDQVAAVVGVDADTSEIPAQIEEATAPITALISVDADTSGIESQIDEAVAGVDTQVDIEANVETSDADEEVDGLTGSLDALSQQATGTGSGLDVLGIATDGFGTVTSLAQGKVGGLTGAVSKIGPGAAAAVGGVVALGGATKLLFDHGLDLVAAEERLNTVFGDQADAVQRINVGGLVGDMGDLAVKIGSSRPELQGVIANLGELGLTAGASRPLVADTVDKLAALGLRAAATRPELGSAATTTDALARAFQRGGRALIPFGLSLSAAEINARAAEIALSEGRVQVSAFDKAAAGAQITVERLGKNLKTDFEDGSKSAVIQLQAVKGKIEETIETAGKPLVKPVLQALEDLAPIAEAAATSLGEILAALIPLGVELLSDTAPALQAAVEAVGLLTIPIGIAVDILKAMPDPLKEVVAAVLLLNLALQSNLAAQFAGGLVALGNSAITALAPLTAAGTATGILAGEITLLDAALLGLGGLATSTGLALSGLGTGIAGTSLSIAALNPELFALAIADMVAPVKDYASAWDEAVDAQAKAAISATTSGKTQEQAIESLRGKLRDVNIDIENQQSLIDAIGTDSATDMLSNFFSTEQTEGEKAHDVLERLEIRHAGLKKAIDLLVGAEKEHKSAAENAKDAVQAAIVSEQEAEQATKNLKDEILGLNDALRAVPNAEVNAEQAHLATLDAVDRLNEAKAAGRQEDESAEQFLRRIRGLELDVQSALLGEASAHDQIAVAADSARTAQDLYNEAVKDPAARDAVIGQLEATKTGLGPEAQLIIQSYIDKLKTLPPEAASAGAGTGTNFGAGVTLGIAGSENGTIGATVNLLGNTATQANVGAGGQGKTVGDSFGMGILLGIAGSENGVIEGTVNLLDNAVSAGRRHIDSNSPSKLTRDVLGIPMGEGIAGGIESTSDQVSAALTSALDEAVSGARLDKATLAIPTIELDAVLTVDQSQVDQVFETITAPLAVNVVPVLPPVAVSVDTGVSATGATGGGLSRTEILAVVRDAVREGGVRVEGNLVGEVKATERQDTGQLAKKIAATIGTV